jgi:DNA-binding transcriptional LysR family regulator
VQNVELRQFRYFIAVAEELHFSRAAERLHIAQSGLSQQIKQLERTVGAQLLVRNRRGVQLTESGRVFLDQARLTLELADRAMASAAMAERGKRALLRVGTPILGIPVAAEPVLQGFRERFPDVEVEIHPRFQPDLVDGVTDHSLDVAIVLSPFKSVDPPLRYLQLGTFELSAIVPAGHRLARLDRVPLSELLEEPVLGWPRSIDPEMIDHIHRVLFGTAKHPQMLDISDLEEARRFEHVANGEGIAIAVLPPGMERQAPGIVFRHFEEPAPLIGYGVAWASHTPPVADPFLELAREFADSQTPIDVH